MNRVSILLLLYRVSFIHFLLFLFLFPLFFFRFFFIFLFLLSLVLSSRGRQPPRKEVLPSGGRRVESGQTRRGEETSSVSARCSCNCSSRRACRLRGHGGIYFNPLPSLRSPSPLFSEPLAATRISRSLSLLSFICFLNLSSPSKAGGFHHFPYHLKMNHTYARFFI